MYCFFQTNDHFSKTTVQLEYTVIFCRNFISTDILYEKKNKKNSL